MTTELKVMLFRKYLHIRQDMTFEEFLEKEMEKRKDE